MKVVGSMKVVCVQEPGFGWFAQILGVPGGITQGRTEVELESNIREVLDLCELDPEVPLRLLFVESPLCEKRPRKNPQSVTGATGSDLRKHLLWLRCYLGDSENYVKHIRDARNRSISEVRKEIARLEAELP